MNAGIDYEDINPDATDPRIRMEEVRLALSNNPGDKALQDELRELRLQFCDL